jgi:hypothetical protein
VSEGRGSGRTWSGVKGAGVHSSPSPLLGLEVSQLLAEAGDIRELLSERYPHELFNRGLAHQPDL